MALRDQPYFPLYVQDYLTDERLSMCSWSAQGIYIKILCLLHKQKTYGRILFKQNSKQNSSTCLDFASCFAKLLPVQITEMEDALCELVENEVLTIDGNELFQKRMVKDNAISEARSIAGRKGGGNPNLFKQNPKHQFKQNPKQNPEYEYEYENKNNSIELNVLFDIFWNLYDKKVGDKAKIEKKWNKLTSEERDLVMDYIPKYKEAQPDKSYRKNPETFLNNKGWLDELVFRKSKQNGYIHPSVLHRSTVKENDERF
jgi:hypothetical protein